MVPPSTCSIRRLYCIESSFSTRANEPRVRGSHIYVSHWTLCERSERADNKLDNLLSACSLPSHAPKGASKMLRATGHARMVRIKEGKRIAKPVSSISVCARGSKFGRSPR